MRVHGPFPPGQDGALHHPPPAEDGAIRQDPHLRLHFLRLGLSPLRTLDCLLNLAVRLTIDCWNERDLIGIVMMMIMMCIKYFLVDKSTVFFLQNIRLMISVVLLFLKVKMKFKKKTFQIFKSRKFKLIISL